MSKRNSGKAIVKAADYKGSLVDFGKYFTVYPDLTQKLDGFTAPFNDQIVNEIVLWKLARYVRLSGKILAQLNDVRTLMPGDHRKSEQLVTALQNENGVQLPMASTFLRFANANVFQIIDRHLYRAVYGTSYLKAIKGFNDEDLTGLYFRYLEKLKQICDSKSLPFKEADRILFEYDKRENPPLTETD